MKVLSFFNSRTLIAIIISQIAAFISITYQIKLNLNLLLFGLAIAFPLNFSIQAAYKRREKALEYFSLFKAGLMALYYHIQISEDLPAEKKTQGTNILKSTADQLWHQLENREYSYEPFQRKLNEIFAFMDTHREELSKWALFRMVRYMLNIQDASSYLMSLATHRTMSGMRFYSVFFVLIFPLVHVPILLYRLEDVVPYWTIHLFAALLTLILVTLTNFQKMIEYPFDQSGIDNIKLREFKLDV